MCARIVDVPAHGGPDIVEVALGVGGIDLDGRDVGTDLVDLRVNATDASCDLIKPRARLRETVVNSRVDIVDLAVNTVEPRGKRLDRGEKV
jgi:hypothetical protein